MSSGQMICGTCLSRYVILRVGLKNMSRYVVIRVNYEAIVYRGVLYKWLNDICGRSMSRYVAKYELLRMSSRQMICGRCLSRYVVLRIKL